MKGDLTETERSLAADKALAAKLAESCGSQSSEWEERQKSKAEELPAIHEAMKLLKLDVRWLNFVGFPKTPGSSASNLRLIFGAQRQECCFLRGHCDV